jgi:hypothetical protein
MFCSPGLIFSDTEVVGSRFHVLRPGHVFGSTEGRRVPFSCCALPDSFSAVPRASGPVFMFCALVLIFGGTEGVVSCFHLLRARPRFRQCRGRWVPFSCFARPKSISAVPRVLGPVFMFCAPGLVFDGAGGVGSRFNCCAPGLIFVGTKGVTSRLMFPALEHVLGGTESFGSRFLILRSRTHFRRYRGCQAPCLAHPDSFLGVSRASGPGFKFYAPGIVFGVTEGVGSRLHVLRARTNFHRHRGR